MKAGVLIGAAAAAVALAGCRSLPTAGATGAALRRVGYRVSGVAATVRTDGSHVDVRVAAPGAEEGEGGKVAGVVWTTLPYRFDHLDVTVDAQTGPITDSFSYAQLADRFGPRLAALDRRSYGREVAAVTSRLFAAAALPGLVLMAGVGVFVLRASRPPP